MPYIILEEIKVDMYIGICDYEYLNKQPVIVNLKLYADIPLCPKDINQCIDYTKISDYIKTWEHKPHTDLVETLMFELLNFCFKDERITAVDMNILKPQAISFVKQVGVGINITRNDYNLQNGI